MAFRVETIRRAWATNTASLATATQYAFPALTIALPTASRTIRSAVIVYSFNIDSATVANITSRQGGIQIDAVAAQDNAVSGTLANTGDHAAYVVSEDLTDYFVANFTGASHSVVARWRQVGAAVINLSAELFLTFEYDDAGETSKTKTIEIVLDSPTARLTSTLAEIGTNQVPLLNTFLPEAGKTLIDAYFIVEGNLASDAVTDFQLGLSLDAEAEVLFGAYRQALTTSNYVRVIWKREDINPAAAHAFNARTTVTNRFEHLTVRLVVTYSYTIAGTSTVINQQLAPFKPEPLLEGPTISEPSRFSAEFFVAEPATVTLVQSGVVLYWTIAGLADLNVRVGGQAYRAYTKAAFTDPAGSFCVAQRFDSGGAQGAGHTLARGRNVITVDAYRTTTTTGTIPLGVFGYALITYTSSVAAAGAGAHNHVTWWNLQDAQATSSLEQVTAAFAPNIPEENYWLNGWGVIGWVMTTAAVTYGMALRLTNGYRMLIDTPQNPAEAGMIAIATSGTEIFQRHPLDPDAARISLETARVVRAYVIGSTQHWPNLLVAVTHHSITFNVTVTVTDYTGDGSGIAVYAHTAADREPYTSVTTAIGGTATAIVYDDSIEYFGHARQDSTHVGRSDDEVPS